MKTFAAHAALALCLLFTACASQPPQQCGPTLAVDEKPEIFTDQVNRDQLIGTWLGTSPVKDGSTVTWLTQRRDDGSFLIRFREKGKGKKNRDQTEAGFWGISAGIYFTITRGFVEKEHLIPVNTSDSNFYDAYKALSISPSEFTYKSLATQEQFTVKRVPDDYQL